MNAVLSPFIYGRSLLPAEFSGRPNELNRVGGRLAKGQSVAVVGQPHVGKTSMLKYIHNAEARRRQYGEGFAKDFFVYVDMLAAQSIRMQGDFWKHVLSPLRGTEHSDTYDNASQDNFGNFALEEAFIRLGQSGSRIVVMMDEFDALLSHQALNNSDFYGGLRSLASRCSEGFTLILAARRSLDQLNHLTQEFNPHGSPYFNVFVEFQLGALKPEALDALLDQAGEVFTKKDRLYIERVSGRHPYLAQAAAASLWDAHEEGLKGAERYRVTGQNLYRQVRQHFSDTWTFWSNTTRKAVTAVALAEIPRLVGNHTFKVKELEEDIGDYSDELDMLRVSGTLTQNDEGEWVVAQEVLLWWLTDEIRRNVRDETPFSDWIRAQHMDNLLTEGDRLRLTQAAQSVTSLVGRGATTLIETLAKGFGEAILKS